MNRLQTTGTIPISKGGRHVRGFEDGVQWMRERLDALVSTLHARLAGIISDRKQGQDTRPVSRCSKCQHSAPSTMDGPSDTLRHVKSRRR